MLKTRIIGVILVKNGIAVQSIRFNRYLPIGKPEIAIHYLDRWGVDEIVVLNIDGAHSSRSFTTSQVYTYAKQCHVPLAIGGGIREINDVKSIVRAGADKIILNNAAYFNQDLIGHASDLFGEQCVVISIDAMYGIDNQLTVRVQGGKTDTFIAPDEYAKKIQALGAGEIFLNSIDKDGTQTGYDLQLIQSVSKTVGIPVIACGGAGHPRHAFEVIQKGASAVAVGNCFHYTEHSVILFKKYLSSLNTAIRNDSYVSYRDNPIDEAGRIAKHDDDKLNHLRFQYIPEETI